MRKLNTVGKEGLNSRVEVFLRCTRPQQTNKIIKKNTLKMKYVVLFLYANVSDTEKANVKMNSLFCIQKAARYWYTVDGRFVV